MISPGMAVPRAVPVRYEFAAAEARAEGWGRFETLWPTGGRLSTRFRLERGDRIRVTFGLPGEPFDSVPAEVRRVRRDLDGFFDAELAFRDEAQAVRLGRVLRDLMARSAA